MTKIQEVKSIAGAMVSKLYALPLTERIGLTGLYLFLFSAWQSKARAAVFFLVMLLPCLFDRRFWQDLKASRTAFLLALLLLYILIRGLLASIENHEYLHYHLKDGVRLMLLGGFVFIAWLLHGDQHRVLLALVIALLGFWAGRLEHFPWSEAFSRIEWWGTRESFGLPSETAFGIYASASAMGLVLLAARVWSVSGATWRKLLAVTLWCMLLMFSIQGIIMAQSRSVWLSVSLLTFILLLLNLHYWRRMGWFKTTMLVLGVAGLLLLLGYANQSTIKKRLATEIDTTIQLLSGNFGEIRAVDAEGHVKSMGVRYHMLMFGIDHWKKNPWFGLGPGISEPLIKKQWVASKTYNHLHNSYLEMLLRLGISGTVLTFVMLAMIFYGGWLAYRERRIDRDLFLFLMAALTLLLLSSITEFRMLHTDWRYYWFLVGGALYSFSLFKPDSLTKSDPVLSPASSDSG